MLVLVRALGQALSGSLKTRLVHRCPHTPILSAVTSPSLHLSAISFGTPHDCPTARSPFVTTHISAPRHCEDHPTRSRHRPHPRPIHSRSQNPVRLPSSIHPLTPTHIQVNSTSLTRTSPPSSALSLPLRTTRSSSSTSQAVTFSRSLATDAAWSILAEPMVGSGLNSALLSHGCTL